MTTKGPLRIGFAASETPVAQTARAVLTARYGDAPLENADIIVALGGDGFMLQTLHSTEHLAAPVYGMNRGTVGFLMNKYNENDLVERLEAAEEADVHPLSMCATGVDGTVHKALATPAGSTAYNYSAHGPVLPIGSDVLALTAVAAFRPRRWRGALLPRTACVRFDVLEPDKRPVMAEADSRSFANVTSVVIKSESSVVHRILFDPGHGLEERLISEQFT